MYKKTPAKNRHIDFFIIDLILFAASYVIGYILRFGFRPDKDYSGAEVKFGIILVVIYFLAALFTSSYKNIMHRGKWIELASVILQLVITFAVFLLYLYFTKQSQVLPRWLFAYMAIAALILIYGSRCLYKIILRNHFRNNYKLPHLLIVSEKDNISDCLASIREKQFNDFFLSGAVVKDGPGAGENVEGCEIVSDYAGLKDYVLSNVVDEVLLSIDDINERTELMEFFLAAGVVVHSPLAAAGLYLPNVLTEDVGGRMVMTISNNTASGIELFLKRFADIIGSIIGLIITGILYLIIAPQIKAKDPGPAIFKQVRIGKNGRRFNIYKFRSMYMDAEERKKELMEQNELEGLVFKMENDPRILPGIGHKIRNWSLDEFPQFLNVFKGDMSLVGTRPPTVDEFEKYEAHHKSRLSFKPGITGLWQVSGRNEITDFEEIVRLDNEYISKWTPWLDVKILVKTLGVVLKRKGSM